VQNSTEQVQCTSALISKQSMGARNRVGIGLSYRPARLHRLAELFPGLLKSFKIRAQDDVGVGGESR
jgi:hypothetical protein